MISTKRISIIIPVYNSDETLGQLLTCICNQSNERDEIILIDDCSLDDSGIICNEFAKNYYGKIKFIENNINHGPSFSRNKGLKAAQGENICFVDSDDMLAPNALDTMYNFAKENNCDIVQIVTILLMEGNYYSKK